MSFSLRKIYFVTALFLFAGISFSEISPDQLKMLEQLPPDQRLNIMEKMESASALQDEIDESFEDETSLIRKPELKNLEEEENFCSECIYGYNFFQFAPSSFAPVNDTPVDANYVLGPGDILVVNFYGANTENVEVVINREGKIILPLLGPVNFLGMTFGQASKFLENKVKSELIGTEGNLSIKEVRSISVYLLGEAYKPGRYVVSGLSTITNALFVSGGVNEMGSLRNIQLKRENDVISTYDFYDFILGGSLESDLRLQDGDVIFIPFIEDSVTLGGAFKRPHRYEIKKGETLKDVIRLAGGFNSEVMSDSIIELSRIDRNASKRVLSPLNANNDSLTKIYDGDVITISSTSGLTPQTIKLTGEIKKPGEYSIQPGDKIVDIIDRAGGYTAQAFTQGALYLRGTVAESQKKAFERSADQLENTIVDIISKDAISEITEFTLMPLSSLIERLRNEEPLGRMVVELDYLKLKTDPVVNFSVKDGDTLHVPKRPNFVSIVGEVLNTTSVSFDPSLGVDEYIELAGGLNDSADKDKIFVILPNGKSSLVKKSLFSSKSYVLPGSTIVISRDSRPFDAINLTQIITPILADLATSAAAIAAISD
tara:strand:+ start:705 stop:2504 length:1800 start_codon:yes stop_codon:yes gene_type:complete